MRAYGHSFDFVKTGLADRRYPCGVQPAVFLDRDNTLIANDGDLGRPDDVRLVEGVARGLKMLREAGFNLVVITNQGGVARGVFTEDDVDAVHQRIAALIDEHAAAAGLIDRFYYCPYHPEGTVAEYRREHLWRKPHPGMILQAARDMELDLARSWMIGDQERDVQAGRAAGCRTVLVTQDSELARRCAPTIVAKDILEAARIVLEHSKSPPAHPGHSNGESSPKSSEKRSAGDDLATLRRTVAELTEEIRSDRARRSDFTLMRMIAGTCQLLAVILALLGVLQLSNFDVFMKWMIGAAMAQLATITLLALDLKG